MSLPRFVPRASRGFTRAEARDFLIEAMVTDLRLTPDENEAIRTLMYANEEDD